MVTLRRDIAEGSKSRIYDSNLTGYDRFMAEKTAKKTVEIREENTVDSVYNAATPVEAFPDYKSYLRVVFDRTEPGEIIPEDEFYKRQYQEKSPKEVKTSPYSKSGKKLSRRSMVFLSAYVLIIAAVTSIIIAVNGTKGVTNVDAKEDGEEITIQAMTVEKSTPESTNWFDRLLDSISNK